MEPRKRNGRKSPRYRFPTYATVMTGMTASALPMSGARSAAAPRPREKRGSTTATRPTAVSSTSAGIDAGTLVDTVRSISSTSPTTRARVLGKLTNGKSGAGASASGRRYCSAVVGANWRPK